ncbi:DNA cytosine methyltransferase [uncultured Alistipes sp.]|uniref:DNA cytosine methyltransferase n=1 Tax=uncultured Alistipes sp. TaxID=538949 RepID=UPI002593B5FC|nr:DNA cytosine methyltransferase [uncultured Alistipes sp.]
MKQNPIRLHYIDLFCGAGGTSTGVERARIDGRKCAEVIACVNHDTNAIASHAANHPHALHFTEDIRTLDLGTLKAHVEKKRRENPAAKLVLWASLECTNHSRAKGGMSRDADSRTLAEHLFRYIEELRPDYIQIENVVEFMEWGPLMIKTTRDPETGAEYCPLDIKRDRKTRTTTVAPVWVPDPESKGTLYRQWVADVCSRGYRFEHRVLNAADYGAYTSRVRYFGQFARPELPMAWPRQTHAKNPETQHDLFTAPLKPWRAVREVLDFDDRGESIFGRKKPLVDATLDRIHAGLVKFVAGGKDAFLVKYNSLSQAGKYIPPSVDAPCPTIATQGRLGVARASFLSKHFGGPAAGKNIPVTGPAGTITTVDHHAFVSAYYGNGYCSSVERPAPTLTTKDRFQLVRPFIASHYSGGGQVTDVDRPAPTLLTNPKQQLVSAHYLLNPQYRSAGGSVDAPCFTLIARMDKRPPYLVSVEQGVPAWRIRPEDTPAMVRLKEFCIGYGIVDITMRMLRIPEMKRIQGFGADYVLLGTQEEQKKFLGNAVVTEMAAALCEATAKAIIGDMRSQIKAAGKAVADFTTAIRECFLGQPSNNDLHA